MVLSCPGAGAASPWTFCVGTTEVERIVETLTESTRVSVEWLLIGLGCQVVILLCFLAQSLASKKRGRLVFPQGILYISIAVSVVLLIYAAVRHDLVFVIGQLTGILVGLRVLDVVRSSPQTRTGQDFRFPMVKPDTAEHKIDVKK